MGSISHILNKYISRPSFDLRPATGTGASPHIGQYIYFSTLIWKRTTVWAERVRRRETERDLNRFIFAWSIRNHSDGGRCPPNGTFLFSLNSTTTKKRFGWVVVGMWMIGQIVHRLLVKPFSTQHHHGIYWNLTKHKTSLDRKRGKKNQFFFLLLFASEFFF